MRPDEHKKKRSAQYNKKHAGNKENQSKGGQKKGAKAKVDAHQPVKVEKTQQPKEVSAKCSSSITDSSDTDEDVSSVKKTYRRREVVSNWDRYEVRQSEEDLPEQRGEDFTKLLNMAGDAGAQFRFKSEEEWEEPGLEGAETDILGVDLSQLDESLRCIPLYERLGVEKDLFSGNQVETMIMEASIQRDQLKIDNYQSDNMDSLKHPSESDHLPAQNPSPSTLKSLAVESKDTNKLRITTNCSDNIDMNTGTLNDTKPGVPSSDKLTNTGHSDLPRELENDLDFLLSLDNPKAVAEIKPESTTKPETKLQDNKPAASETDIQVEKNETESLEDWLDDFLDD